MELEQLVGLKEISVIAGVSVAAVANWRTRHSDFPKPITHLDAGPVFIRAQVLYWLNNRRNRMAIIISFFNNKGGVGKTTSLWNTAVSLAAKGKRILVIDFDPQCNFSIACLGSESFVECLKSEEKFPYGKTIKSFTLPYIQQSRQGDIYLMKPKEDRGNLDIVPGDFWLNNFSDILNVGTDVIGGSGLYRFLTPAQIVQKIQIDHQKEYDFVLIDLPPAFNSLVRSALYSSDYFIVPCTADTFSAYCVGLIGEMLPIFSNDWRQGVERYTRGSVDDQFVATKGKPKFGGWIFNGFDTRKARNSDVKAKVGADRAQYKLVKDSIKNKLIERLNGIKEYKSIPDFVTTEPLAEIEDLNVMAPDSIVQSVPIKYLQDKTPTRDIYSSGKWDYNQIDLMKSMDQQYDLMAESIIRNFT